MTRTSTTGSPNAPAALAAVLALFCLAAPPPALAADPSFPVGSLVGLVPPPGMAVSKHFQGFEDPSKDSAILVATQAASAFDEIQKSLDVDSLKKQGITVDKRESVKYDFGNGTLVTGKQTDAKTVYRKWLLVAQAKDLTILANAQTPEKEAAYPDAAIRAALASLALRAKVPEAEMLSVLPFSVGDLAGFHVQSVMTGRAMVLIDAPDGKATDNFDPRMFVAAFPGGPAESDDRAQFARLAFDQIIGIKDVEITMSEPLRINGQSGFQTVAKAKDAKSNADIMVAQWLRFSGGGFFQMIGMSKADVWPTALNRMRTVRDSIEPK